MALNEPIRRFHCSRTAPVQNIKAAQPACYVDTNECEATIQIGLFFDGTSNNRKRDEPKLSHSNVARLCAAYPANAEKRCHVVYVPGLGTSFPEVGESGESMFGGAFGSGGDSRIMYALLQFFNVIARSLFAEKMFKPELVKALSQHAKPSKYEKELLAQAGISEALVSNNDSARRRQFFDASAEILQGKMKFRNVPKIRECFVDVFGFSRGAAEARVFCDWLLGLLTDQKMVGIPIRFRFLGLMDTVASVGIRESVKNGAYQTGGHDEWATVGSMRIRAEIENCVHMVAMHELRKSFPLDAVSVGGILPPNCFEYAYPGAHSDIGGGYGPGELGIATGRDLREGDALKLSQIPLNHMYDCAVAAGVPLSKKGLVGSTVGATFAVHESVQRAFNKFLDSSTENPRTLGDWALPYLVWRWQLRRRYEKTVQAIKANSEDRRLLLESNDVFCDDDEQLQNAPVPWYRDASKASDGHPYQQLEPEAKALHARVIAQGKVSPALAEFFDGFVHDSIAGFRKQFVEATGYWRYRRVFQGSTTPIIG
jgi:hypothetical protein